MGQMYLRIFFYLFFDRISINSATELDWSIWEALITMQRKSPIPGGKATGPLVTQRAALEPYLPA